MVALEAQSAHVGEIAFPAALGHRHDVVGVPKLSPAAPVLFELSSRPVVQLALIFTERLRVGAALGADAAVAQKYLFPQIAPVRAQPPFMDARIPTKSEA